MTQTPTEVAGNLHRGTGLRKVEENVMDTFKIKHAKTTIISLVLQMGNYNQYITPLCKKIILFSTGATTFCGCIFTAR